MFTILIILFNIIWTILFLPFAVVSTLSKKLRHPFFHRFGIHRRIRKWKQQNNNQPVITVHCASYGEFEHIRLFLQELKNNQPTLKIAILFFSPSGYLNINAPDIIDLKIYTPFDTIWSNWRVFKNLNPRFHLIAKHDVWPSEIFILNKLGIPIYMLNGSLSKNSSRIRHFLFFQKMIYARFTKIFAVSEGDRDRFVKYLEIEKNKIEAIGDTKNDQALKRRQKAESNSMLKGLKERINKTVFVGGSIWPEDWDVLKEATVQAVQAKQCHAILVPHEIHPDFINRIEADCAEVECVRFSNLEEKLTRLPTVLIVDQIGMLAELYALGDFAFVGGSYKSKIHNVLEPAVYGIPVLTGPKIENSTDAMEMKNSGLLVLETAGAFKEEFNHILQDETYRRQIGKMAEDFVNSRLGTSSKLVKQLTVILKAC